MVCSTTSTRSELLSAVFYTIESAVRRVGYKVRSRREDAASNFYMQQDVFVNRKRHYFVLFGAAKFSSSLQQISKTLHGAVVACVPRRQWPYLDMITEPRDVRKSARNYCIPAVHGKSA